MKRMTNKDFRDGVVLAAITSVDLIIKVFASFDIEATEAIDALLAVADLSDEELDDVEKVIKIAYKAIKQDNVEFSALDVLIGVLIKLVEKKDAEGIIDKATEEVEKEIINASDVPGTVN